MTALDPLPRRDGDDDTAAAACRHGRGVLLLDIEPALAALITEWLAREGLRTVTEAAGAADAALALIVIDLPFPRAGGAQRLHGLARAWPGVPVLALSPTFHAGIAAQGDVARQLGAAAVLALPITEQPLRRTVMQLVAAADGAGGR